MSFISLLLIQENFLLGLEWVHHLPFLVTKYFNELLFLFQADPQWWAEWGVVWWGEDHHQSWEVSSLCLYVRVLKCFKSDLFIYFFSCIVLKKIFFKFPVEKYFPDHNWPKIELVYSMTNLRQSLKSVCLELSLGGF